MRLGLLESVTQLNSHALQLADKSLIESEKSDRSQYDRHWLRMVLGIRCGLKNSPTIGGLVLSLSTQGETAPLQGLGFYVENP